MDTLTRDKESGSPASSNESFLGALSPRIEQIDKLGKRLESARLRATRAKQAFEEVGAPPVAVN